MKRKVCSKCWEQDFEIVKPEGIENYLIRCVSCEAIIMEVPDKMGAFFINEKKYSASYGLSVVGVGEEKVNETPQS